VRHVWYNVLYLTCFLTRGLGTLFLRSADTAMRFFDTQPTGRILNRFSKDIDYVDDLMPLVSIDVAQLGLQCIAVCVVVCVIDPCV